MVLVVLDERDKKIARRYNRRWVNFTISVMAVAGANTTFALASSPRIWEALSIGALLILCAAFGYVCLPTWDAKVLRDEEGAVLVSANDPRFRVYKSALAMRAIEGVSEGDLATLKRVWLRTLQAPPQP